MKHFHPQSGKQSRNPFEEGPVWHAAYRFELVLILLLLILAGLLTYLKHLDKIPATLSPAQFSSEKAVLK